MSTNISKQKREDLLNKIKEIRTFIASAPQDENTGNLLSYLSDLEKDVNGKKYGLVFEEHREEIDEVLDTHTPVLTEEKELFIDNGGQMNFLIEGDNLASLKLLQKTHKNSMDLIYIDPPYNTGNKDFIYDDCYVDSEDGFRHSKWIIIVQIPNKSDALLDRVEEYFESKGITYENNLLAVWLSDKKQNLEDIEQPNTEPIAVIIKQAVATGWDCPRSQILVKLRDNMSEVFEIQTIGRIRRMPEAKHYESDLLDSCYLYTLDEKFTESVKQNLGKGALDAYKVFLKPEYRSLTLISEYKTDVPYPRDAKLSLKVIYKYFEKKYHITGDTAKNKTLLEAHGYSFAADIIDYTKSGSVNTLSKENIAGLNDISIHEPLNTHKHGKEYHHCVAEIGYKVNLDYNSTNTIMRKLFLNGLRCDFKILKIETKELYAFIINNERLLVEDVRDATADEALQLTLAIPKTTEKPLGFPLEMIFTYDGTAKSQVEFSKNVYKGYLSSAENRSLPEKLFERYCENSNKIQWFYKNGDRGIEYFSIVYTDNFGKQKSFYPDYIIGTTDGKIWIIETKGGFTKTGDSEDIDKYTAKKFRVLKSYTEKYKLLGGIVRQDKQSGELCICTETYSEDIKSDSWKLLSDVL